MTDRTVLVVNLVLSVLFLVAGVVVMVVSNFTVGVGLLSTAVGMGYGTASMR